MTVCAAIVPMSARQTTSPAPGNRGNARAFQDAGQRCLRQPQYSVSRSSTISMRDTLRLRALQVNSRQWGPVHRRPRRKRTCISFREVATTWSRKIGQFAGIGLYMHATFLLLGFVTVSRWVQARSLEAVLSGMGFILALFACVVAYEYGHAAGARRLQDVVARRTV